MAHITFYMFIKKIYDYLYGDFYLRLDQLHESKQKNYLSWP